MTTFTYRSQRYAFSDYTVASTGAGWDVPVWVPGGPGGGKQQAAGPLLPQQDLTLDGQHFFFKHTFNVYFLQEVKAPQDSDSSHISGWAGGEGELQGGGGGTEERDLNSNTQGNLGPYSKRLLVMNLGSTVSGLFWLKIRRGNTSREAVPLIDAVLFSQNLHSRTFRNVFVHCYVLLV
jgi:hypothetical protein